MTTFDRLQRSAKNAEIKTPYDMDLQQVISLLDHAGHHDSETFQAIMTAFEFGFVQGIRQTQKEIATTAIVAIPGAND